MNILFLAPYPENESPSQRYRFEHYLPYLRQKDIDFAYKPFLSLSAWKIFFGPGNTIKKISGLVNGFFRRWLLMFTIGRYDFVFVHREVAPIGPPIFEWIIAKLYGKRIIYDFDDAIWVPAASNHNKAAKYFKWFSKVKTICRWSYKITAGNDYLADYALQYNNNVIVVPTVVDTEEVHNEIQDHAIARPAIGWTGSFSTLKYIDIIVPVLQDLQNKYNFVFIVIADQDPVLPLKNYQFIKWKKSSEADDLLKIHIGVMPLYDDVFSRGKCGFKAIQYMALGIPAVVSPVGVNSKIVDDAKNGFVCEHTAEWYEKLSLLLENAALRKEFGAEARKKIESGYSVMATRDIFLKLFM